MAETQLEGPGPLRGLRVLIVEDMWLVAFNLSEMLEDWGVEVAGPAGQLDEGLRHARHAPLDGALLDVNLGENLTSVPIASALRDRGVPFIFISGYDTLSALPREFAERPKLSKPVEPLALAETMTEFFLAKADKQ